MRQVKDPRQFIVHVHGGVGSDQLHLNIIEKLSGLTVMELTIPNELFAKAMWGTGADISAFIISEEGHKLLGLTQEHKNEVVWFPEVEPYYGRDQEKKKAYSAAINTRNIEALKPFEIDGWKGELNHVENRHYYVDAKPPTTEAKGNWVKTHFVRFVKK